MKVNDSFVLTKTDYLLFRECKKNAWIKIHKPEIYYQFELSEFEKTLIEAGGEVELFSHQLFPEGIIIEDRDTKGEEDTRKYILNKQPILHQPVFIKDGFMAIIDTLSFNEETGKYSINEVKSSTEVKKKFHYHDLTFQLNVLKKCGLEIEKTNLIHLNPEYIRFGKLDIEKLFLIEDLTGEVESLSEEVSIEMETAFKYLSQESEPSGFCDCVYKGRSNHCNTFSYSNPEIPEYSIHDIVRIGSSKKKLQELVDGKYFHIHEIPKHIKLSDNQMNQVNAHIHDKILFNKEKIIEELKNLIFPLYFLDYETFPAAIPRHDGFSPFHQIPFQYSLYILDSLDSEPKHFEFLYVDSGDPSKHFAESLMNDIGDTGHIVVWNKTFESNINGQLAERLTEFESFMNSINNRMYDLMDIFRNQHFVHKEFRGGYSIKRILPVLVPDLTYKEIEIRDGGMAAQNWNKMMSNLISEGEKIKIMENLKIYCGLDTYAMYKIWNSLSLRISQ